MHFRIFTSGSCSSEATACVWHGHSCPCACASVVTGESSSVALSRAATGNSPVQAANTLRWWGCNGRKSGQPNLSSAKQKGAPSFRVLCGSGRRKPQVTTPSTLRNTNKPANRRLAVDARDAAACVNLVRERLGRSVAINPPLANV